MQIYTVKKGDTLSAIAKSFKVPLQDIIRDNQISTPDRIVVGQALVIMGASQTLYTVRRGDTLTSIARMFGVTVNDLLRANPSIVNPDLIYTNQQLVIPVGTAPQRSILANGYCYTNISNSTLNTTLPFLTYISPFSYEVRRDGSLSTLNDSTVIASAKSQRVAPLMVITNIDQSTGNFSSDLASAVLTNVRVQDILLNNIVSIMCAKGFLGLDVDFEYVYGRDRENYNAFLKRAVNKLHPLGYTVSTALPPKTSVNQPGLLFEGIDFAAHGRIVDMTLIMTYNWGYQYGPPMAVSPLNLMEPAVQFAVSQIPSEKILLGIPNYGYDWILPYQSGRPAQLIMNIAAVNLAAANWSEIKFDRIAQAPYFNYRDNQGRERVVWFDDARSMEAKFGLVSKYKLGGIGYWNINTLFLPGWLVLRSMYNIDKIIT